VLKSGGSEEERLVVSFEALEQPHRFVGGDAIGLLGFLSSVREPAPPR